MGILEEGCTYLTVGATPKYPRKVHEEGLLLKQGLDWTGLEMDWRWTGVFLILNTSGQPLLTFNK